MGSHREAKNSSDESIVSESHAAPSLAHVVLQSVDEEDTNMCSAAGLEGA